MKKPSSLSYALFSLVAFLPFGIRGITWLIPDETAVDPEMAGVGQELFLHDWTSPDPLAGSGDGLGPVFNATSCVACHRQGGVGGGGPVENNVTVFTVRPVDSSHQFVKSTSPKEPRQGVVHAFAIGDFFQETLANIDGSLADVNVSLRNTPALFGAQLIDQLPDRAIIANERRQKLKWSLAGSDVDHAPVGRALRLSDGRVGKFGWKAQTASLLDFVQGACANELGLGNPGAAQPAPLGQPDYEAPALDLSQEQCLQLTAFVASLRRPVNQTPDDPELRLAIEQGERHFHSVGCADCHTPDCGNLKGLYSDLLLHRMGRGLEGGGSYGDPPLELPEFTPGGGPVPSEWRTPPLWGVADSAPYLHDGRAASMAEAIRLHAGQAASSVKRFQRLKPSEHTELMRFLESLRAPKVDIAPTDNSQVNS